MEVKCLSASGIKTILSEAKHNKLTVNISNHFVLQKDFLTFRTLSVHTKCLRLFSKKKSLTDECNAF